MRQFFNPYHFVDVQGYRPRYEIVPHDRFSGHCGRIEAELELASPGFIPDPEETYYIISDETVKDDEADQQTIGKVHETIKNWVMAKNIDLNKDNDILFDADVRNWDPEKPGKHLKKAEDNSPAHDKVFVKGKIIEEGGKFCVKTHEPVRWAHKVMHFFKLNGKYTLPSTSLRGMLRNIVETLSNSCFTGFDEDQSEEYLFHRLEPKSSRGLRPVVLKKVDGQWAVVCVDQAKVLSPHLFNRIGASGENALCGYWNTREKCWEKIAPKGNSSPNGNGTGLQHYHMKKRGRGKIQEIESDDNITVSSGSYCISKIKGKEVNGKLNLYRKRFPYIEDPDPKTRFWAIIRRKVITHNKPYDLYSIKVVSPDKALLNKSLVDFNDPSKNPDSNNDDVCYNIAEVRIKTSFDIEPKTQNRVFFVFGKEDFEAAVKAKIDNKEYEQLDNHVINQFRSLLRQRKANAEKVPLDKKGLNREIAKALPDDIRDGMLAYYHPGNKYLTYTTVPQKPYKASPYSLLAKLDKLQCTQIDWLCPACQMFGIVVSGKDSSRRGGEKPSGYKGKVVVSNGELITKVDAMAPVTLKPLGSPKPTFYPFYIINNRKKGDAGCGRSADYDSNDIRIGRKVYLHHHPDKLEYSTAEKTNLNATVHPLPQGTKFRFTIDFENLTTYELGLLLYALDMKFGDKQVGHHIGMGKPLGLGSCRIEINGVWIYDMPARYRQLKDDSWRNKLLPDEIGYLERAYKYVQASPEGKIFHDRHKNLDAGYVTGINSPSSQTIEKEYFSIPYIWEYHFLKSLNFDRNLRVDHPVRYGGERLLKGFEWYGNAKRNPEQRLFDPYALKDALASQQSIEHSMLSP